MEILIIFFLILLNGVFSMSEIALVSARKFKLENAAMKGNSNAVKALQLSENPNTFLSTVQIGITLIGILTGIYSGEKITVDVKNFISKIDFLAPYADSISVVAVLIVLTFFSIVLGELIPKRIGLMFPEKIAMIMAKPMSLISIITKPFIWLLTKTNNLVLGIFGLKDREEGMITEEEIKAIVKESAEGGEIMDIEHNIVERVFQLGDRKVESLFTHKSDMIFVDEADTWEEVQRKIGVEKHSAYPVTSENNTDKIVGILLLKDLIPVPELEGFSVRKHMRQPLFVNEHKLAYRLLELFREQKLHYAVVIDEYGATIGIVTMDDVLDALVGNVTENGQEEYNLQQRSDNSWLVDGQFSIIDFVQKMDLQEQIDYRGKFNTVGGMLMTHLHHLPEVGEVVTIEGYSYEVIDKDGQRIDKILVTKLSE